jgi:8-oxo-dGTP diphosphatase
LTSLPPPIRVVCAVVERGRRVLVARRGPGMRHPGTWEFPGGKVEPGEGDAEALERELVEELAWRVRVGAMLGEGTTGRVHLVGYLCAAEGEPVPGEHDLVAWVESEALPNLAWAPADGPVVEGVLRWFGSTRRPGDRTGSR